MVTLFVIIGAGRDMIGNSVLTTKRGSPLHKKGNMEYGFVIFHKNNGNVQYLIPSSNLDNLIDSLAFVDISVQ